MLLQERARSWRLEPLVLALLLAWLQLQALLLAWLPVLPP